MTFMDILSMSGLMPMPLRRSLSAGDMSSTSFSICWIWSGFRVFRASAAWRMDSGVMSPGFGGIICRRVVRGAGGSTKACAVAAAKNSLWIRMVVRHFF